MIHEAVWHDDGHQMHLELVKTEVVISSVSCPGGECSHPDTDCIVRWFLERYGLECNVGTCPADPDIRIAWTYIGSKKDIESGQVWVIPSSDSLFSAWVEAETH